MNFVIYQQEISNWLVGGLWMEKEDYHFIVNHWPARSGGEARSQTPIENKEAARLKHEKIIGFSSKF